MRKLPVAQYEAMFLFPQSALSDMKAAVAHIMDVVGKGGAEILAIKKWGDRPLAYPINKQKRGVYILCYFKASTDKLAAMERSFNLSEQLLRFLITRADHLTMEEVKNHDGQLDLLIEANLRAAAQPTPPPTDPARGPAGGEDEDEA
ncbi:MAG: 30S ribosomal protein S6 [bacterium]